MTHCRSESEASSSRWMSGSATFTIVMSSSSMNTPVQTAARVHHFERVAALWSVATAWWDKGCSCGWVLTWLTMTR